MRGSAPRIFIMSATAWIATAPLFMAGCLVGLIVWPLCRGFMFVWRCSED